MKALKSYRYKRVNDGILKAETGMVEIPTKAETRSAEHHPAGRNSVLRRHLLLSRIYQQEPGSGLVPIYYRIKAVTPDSTLHNTPNA